MGSLIEGDAFKCKNIGEKNRLHHQVYVFWTQNQVTGKEADEPGSEEEDLRGDRKVMRNEGKNILMMSPPDREEKHFHQSSGRWR